MARQSDRDCVYTVEWEDGVFKIGYTGRGRYRAFLNRGGRLVDLVTFDNASEALAHEWDAHELARSTYVRAFTDRDQAVPYLGGRGHGWVECYLKERPSGG